jgi:anthranilate synthase/aminodeoxychorismate synthase-like glutamine amidotransferase
MMQEAIGQAFGAKVVRAPAPCHGKTSVIEHMNIGLFRDVPSPTKVGRYHSLVLDRDSIPDCLETTAWSEDGLVMGVQHRDLPVYGLQFHPESILTDHGYNYLRSFLRLAGIEFNNAENHELLGL